MKFSQTQIKRLSINFYTTLFLTFLLLCTFYASPSPGAWNTSQSTDEMTGELSAHASSKRVHATKRMEFPYQDVESWVGVGCDGEDEWAYFGFTKAPNINTKEVKRGYNVIRTRTKFDEDIYTLTFSQEWGANFLHVVYEENSFISKLEQSNEVLLELNWHGSGKTYFKFPLNGSSAAIKKIREVCK